MQTFLPPSGNTIKILGKPKPAEHGLRWMTYVLAQPVEGGVLVFHTLTRALLLLTPEEYAAPDNLPELRDGWFRVPQEMNDQKYADQVRFIRRTMWKEPEHITSYTIFTTTDCNARCFYCYEMGRSRIPMSAETAHKAAAYIAAHCGGEKVHLHWFGGEPLFNKQVIDIICTDLAEKGIVYESMIISNGYLFDGATVEQAVSHWKLKSVQITLDGTEEIYNRSKAFIYKDSPSPYQVVLANIQRLLDAGVSVHIRLNMDEHNADNLMELADELHERFGGKGKFSVYSHTLFEFAGSKTHIYNFEMHVELYHKIYDTFNEKYADVKQRLIPDAEVPYRFHFTPEDFYVFAIAHAYKHYSRSGTGIRTLADIYIMNQKLGGTLNWEYVDSELRGLGIFSYEHESRELAQKIFGIAELPTKANLSEAEQQMLAYYLGASTYGTIENRILNQMQKLQPDDGAFTARTKRKYLLSRIFPGREWCKAYAPTVYKYPVLLPLFWVWRLIYKGITNRKKVTQEIKTIKAGKQN